MKTGLDMANPPNAGAPPRGQILARNILTQITDGLARTGQKLPPDLDKAEG